MRVFEPQVNFVTSTVGSFPQPMELRTARTKLRKGEMTEAGYRTLAENYTRHWMQFQENIDINVPVGGEFLREDMAAHFGVRVGGRTRDFVASYENRRYRPVEYFQNIKSEAPLVVNDFIFTQSLTDRPLKETLTGPATLADWALIRHERYYKDRKTFRMDFAKILRDEIENLLEAGVKIIQIDEPALTTKMRNFSMDCEAIYETVRDFDDKLYLILHICYSDMEALDAAFPYLLKLPFHQIHMEMANRRYGMLRLIEKHGFGGKDIGLGVIDVHTNRIESVEEIVEGVKKTLELKEKTGNSCFHPSQIWITPDCGLKERSEEVAKKKLEVMAEAAKVCRS